MNPLKILILVHQDCVPPKGATVKMADWAIWKTEFHVIKTLKKQGHKVIVYGVNGKLIDLKNEIDLVDPHIIFNLLEDFQGEASFESHVVSFLELLRIPYTGCNPQGLSIGRDKALSKKILNFHGVLTPGFFTVEKGKSFTIPEDLKFPLIVKSLIEEASLGISQDSIVHNQRNLIKRVRFIHNKIGTDALVEEYIQGRELYVGVLGSKQLKVLSPWELDFGTLAQDSYPIATRNVKFNKSYCEKYEISRGPMTNLPQSLKRKVEEISRSAYKALKLSGYARLDFRLTEEGELYFLEANPNAELARGECLANAAQQSGLPYDDLITKILRLGLSYKQVA
jgi:D-alanine-D-alanine ligase